MNRRARELRTRPMVNALATSRVSLAETALITLVAAIATLYLVLNSSLFQDPLAREAGCFSDGRWYCAMATGSRGIAPFNRRILVPATVRALHFGTLAQRFRFVDLVSLAVIALGVGVLAGRLARSFGKSMSAARKAAVLAGALTLLAPTPSTSRSSGPCSSISPARR